MAAIELLPLTHSWPLYDAALHLPFDSQPAPFDGRAWLAHRESRMTRDAGMGLWHCDLAAGDRLSWTGAVFSLFGLPEDEPIERAYIVSLYEGESRAAMEALRAHAIRHMRGFSLDALIRRPDGDQRWMRLTAMPILSGGKAVGLCGTKQDVTAEYDGPG